MSTTAQNYARIIWLETNIDAMKQKESIYFHSRDLQNPRKRGHHDHKELDSMRLTRAEYEKELQQLQKQTLALLNESK